MEEIPGWEASELPREYDDRHQAVSEAVVPPDPPTPESVQFRHAEE